MNWLKSNRSYFFSVLAGIFAPLSQIPGYGVLHFLTLLFLILSGVSLKTHSFLNLLTVCGLYILTGLLILFVFVL